jgi:IS30 family transposase
MKIYQHLSITEREEISRYLVLDYSCRQIAFCLKRSTSTITREIRRTRIIRLDYRAILAQKRAYYLKHKPRKQRKLDINQALHEFVLKHLKLRWSPEQIAKRLKFLYPDDMEMRVSHETIYAYIYVHPRGMLKRRIVKQLRRKHVNRRVQSKERQKSYPIQDYISIEDRPIEVQDRTIAGHWEGDLIMGALNKSAIGTLVERTTRLTLLVRLPKKDSLSVCEAFTKEFNVLPETLKKSLTYDHGCEMAQHKQFTENTKIKVYFAHPHSPWERGTSENTNMLVRDFFPRGTDFTKITKKKLKNIQGMLNDRPRKILNWYTPHEAFTKTVALEPRM